MDDYMREMVDLKTLVTKTLEKKGVLARIRVSLSLSFYLCKLPHFLHACHQVTMTLLQAAAFLRRGNETT